jgi:hypothetical protein
VPVMAEVVCPNCREKLKIKDDKKYVDCYFCGHEFKLGGEGQPEKKAEPESVFGKFLREKGLDK